MSNSNEDLILFRALGTVNFNKLLTDDNKRKKTSAPIDAGDTSLSKQAIFESIQEILEGTKRKKYDASTIKIRTKHILDRHAIAVIPITPLSEAEYQAAELDFWSIGEDADYTQYSKPQQIINRRIMTSEDESEVNPANKTVTPNITAKASSSRNAKIKRSDWF